LIPGYVSAGLDAPHPARLPILSAKNAMDEPVKAPVRGSVAIRREADLLEADR